ncbi:aminotransferase class I/II-fold pyridoxal phosphate-dependent enzyme [Nannocystaceae bacterium ST9]
MTGPGNQRLERRLAHEHGREQAQRLTRRCPPIERTTSLHYRLEGRPVVSFCSNDYLGFADELGSDERSIAGSAASRLVCGDLDEHRELERSFAEFLELPDAVLFPSGFQANVGVPACLLRADDRVSSDELNHASMIDGLRLASADRQVIPHGTRPAPVDVEGLHWWFTESIFSMDGDGPSLADLDAHLDGGGCIYLDEAHAIGLHERGRGRALGLRSTPTVVVAPLGKAFGCAGAIVASSASVCSWIRAHARSFVFTTGVSPVLIPRLARALELVRGPIGDERRAALWRNVALLRRALGLDPRALPSPILPWIAGANHDALALSQRLLERGWHVQAIRPPTVPEGGARLRITVSAMHEADELERFAADLLACAVATPSRDVGGRR